MACTCRIYLSLSPCIAPEQVSSRLRLDASSRMQHARQWERRQRNNRPGGGDVPDSARSLMLELHSDPHGFAFGGVNPGSAFAKTSAP